MKNLKCVIWSLKALTRRLRPGNKSMVIRMNEAGTLPSLIASHLKYRIVELTLIGELNGTDLRYIREMSGCDANGKETGGCLSVLDLSGVNIVNGGNTYYGNYSASDNKIGDYTFYKCVRLTRVIMPENLLSVGEGAFGCCYNLSSVVIPDKVRDIGELAFYGCETVSAWYYENPGLSRGILNFFTGQGKMYACKGQNSEIVRRGNGRPRQLYE